MLKTQVISAFLKASTLPELSELYNINMEVQINVAQDAGEVVEGEFNGRKWFGFSDGLETWKSFRIPWNASSKPEFTDSRCNFDFAKHVEAIGLSGWDWAKGVSRWVTFDFDSIANHSKGLAPSELNKISDALAEIPWVTVRKSSSGAGLHIYIFFDTPPETATHTEHAALARAVLGQMSALTGYSLGESVDVCGGMAWIWRRGMNNESYRLVKRGDALENIPMNWRDHIEVVSKKRVKPKSTESVDKICGQYNKIKLDEDHKRLFKFLEDIGAYWWWDNDRHMFVAHTHDLKLAHTQLGLKGLFDTLATGKERGADQNCFGFPLRNGGWIIRRHSKGVSENPIWDQDGEGWTRVYYNRLPDLQTVSRKFDAMEDLDGSFTFCETEVAAQALRDLNVFEEIPTIFNPWPAKIRLHKDGRIVLTVTANTPSNFPVPAGWIQKKDTFYRIFNKRIEQPEVVEIMENVDDYIRHISEGGTDQGWLVFNNGDWVNEPLQHVRLLLQNQGYKMADINAILGSSVENCWRLVNTPFQPEYPGDRQWNKGAPQLRYLPKTDVDNLQTPTWNLIFNHCGASLDEHIRGNYWCKKHGIYTGADYLRLWVASLIKFPNRPLPYLFFYGPQGSGKTVFHESLRLLFTSGVIDGGKALKSQGDFNGEIYRTILCYVEELDLNRNVSAYNKLKDWVTAKEISIHHKGKTPFMAFNTTHWIQCSNDFTYCPVFPGDTRITMSYVPAHKESVPRHLLDEKLIKEATDFITLIMHTAVPESSDRLNVPVISTPDKESMMSRNMNPVEAFIKESCFLTQGAVIPYGEFCQKFLASMDITEAYSWTKTKIGRALPPSVSKGRATWDGSKVYLANITFDSTEPASGTWVIDEKEFLRR